jgi:YVTN family beta-propeller protein
VDFRILGTLEVADEGRELALTGGKQSALLAILLLHPNEVVPSDRLIDELWGERSPATAAKSLQVHVSRLRAAFEDSGANRGDGVVLTRGGGYLIRVRPRELDRDRFERLVQEASGALGDAELRRALELLAEAFALWRGPPLADFAYEPFAQQEIARLEELHLAATEMRIEAELALGQHARLIGELEALVKQHPFRERLRAQLMLALYRAGRQTEALQAYQAARRTLVDEVGVEPGQELRALERAVLAQDPALDLAAAAAVAPPEDEAAFSKPPDQAPPPGRPRPGRPLAAAAIGVGAVGLAAVALLVLGRDDNPSGGSPLTDDSHAVAVIDPSTNQVDEALSVGTRPGSLAFDRESGSLWVANVDDETVTHIEAGRRRVGRTVSIGGAPTGLAAGGGALWVTSSKPGTSRVTLQEINASFDTVERTEQVGELPGERPRVALGGATLWVAPQFGLLTRVNPRTGSVLRPAIDSGHYQDAVAAGDGSAWVAGGKANTVTRIDAASGATTAIPVGNGPVEIALGDGAVWVTLGLEDSVARIDPDTGAVEKTIPVGRSPAGVAVGAGAVWVANTGDGTVTRIDPHADETVTTIPVGGSPQDVTVAAGRVWVSVRPRTLPESRPGGTLRMEVASRLTTMDPALAYGVSDWLLAYPIGARLLNYPDAPAPAGSELQPEVATSRPSRSKDGRTYTFTIRKGFRFSPPSGEPVTAATFRYSIERALSPKMKGPAGGFVPDIVGARDYTEGKAEHITGITVSKDKLRIRLVRPVGDFPTRIATPFFTAVPTDTPIDPKLGTVPPSAGPYYVASFDEDEGALLKRNPNYHGGRPRRPEQIRYTVGVKRRLGLAQVETGSADYAPVTEFVDKASQAAGLARRYGPGSDAAKAGRQRYFVSPTLSVDHIALNTSRPLFSSAKIRQAVNYAIDRRALERQGGLNFVFPFSPTDQYLPPGMPGFRDLRIYPFRPNLEKARRLVGGQRRTAVLYTYNEPASARVAQIVKSNLGAIGIDVDIKPFSRGIFFKRISKENEPYDMALTGWFVDYADPADFLSLLDGRTLDETSYLSDAFPNLARFDDPTFNRRLVAAEKLSGPRRYIAYARLEHDLARDGAPWIAFGNETSHDFFSARVGCQVYQPVYGIDLGALCIRKHAG